MKKIYVTTLEDGEFIPYLRDNGKKFLFTSYEQAKKFLTWAWGGAGITFYLFEEKG